MNKVWEIIEKHKGERSSEGYGPLEGMRRGRMSGHKFGKSHEYHKGIKEGICIALEVLAEVAESMETE